MPSHVCRVMCATLFRGEVRAMRVECAERFAMAILPAQKEVAEQHKHNADHKYLSWAQSGN